MLETFTIGLCILFFIAGLLIFQKKATLLSTIRLRPICSICIVFLLLFLIASITWIYKSFFDQDPSVLTLTMMLESFTIMTTVLNFLIAFFIGVYSIRFRNTFYVIFFLFIYISLHYSYSMILIFGNDSFHRWFYRPLIFYLHDNSLLGVKIIGLCILFFIAGLLIFQIKATLLSTIRQRPICNICIVFLVWFLIASITWIYKSYIGQYPSFLTLQDIASSFLMMTLAFVIAVFISDNTNKDFINIEKMLQILLVLIIIMDALSLYQIVTDKVFAGVLKPNGEYERRACALLFNPNLFGLWCAFIGSATAYAFHSCKYSKINTMIMFIFVAFGILSSGSRSGLLVLLFMLCSVSLLKLKGKNIKEIMFIEFPLFLFTSIFILIASAFKIFNTINGRSIGWLNEFSILAERFAMIPFAVYSYAKSKLYISMIDLFDWVFEYTGISIFKEISTHFSSTVAKIQMNYVVFTTIDGRLNPNAPEADNGFIMMYNDTGWLGLVLWLILWLLIVIVGVKSFRLNSGINGAYALSAIFTCLFLSLFIRSFQVYPVWVMVSISLGLSLSWFQTVLGHKDINEYSV